MGAKPRIIAFITSYFPDVGGAEVALRQVTERLSDQFEFHVVTSRRRRAFARNEVLDDAHIRRLGIGSRIDKWLLPVVALTLRQELAAGSERPSLLWGIDITQASLAAALRRRRDARLRLIITIQYGEAPERLASGRGSLIGRSLRYMLSCADCVTAISTPLMGLAQKYGYRKPVTLIPNGVDIDRFQRREPRSESRPPTVITVGRLVHKNGVDTVIRAVAKLADTFPGLECGVVGDGPERAALERLAGNLGVGGRVRFHGSRPHEEVAPHLWESDVFVRPSRSEGLGTAFVEALAAGLPIIGTPVGGITDIIHDGKTGLLVEVDDPEDLADKIRLLFTRQEFAADLVRRGMTMVQERFDADHVAQRYAGIFHEVLQG